MRRLLALLALLAALDARAEDGSPVTCEVRSTTPAATREVGDRLDLDVRVCNASGGPLRLVESVEHSEIGARLPRTSFLIGGPALVRSDLLVIGCPRIPGILAGDVVRLRPGACMDPFRRRPSVTLASARLESPGRYTVTFQYATRRQGQGLVPHETPAARRALRDVALVDVECSIDLDVIAGD